MRVQTYDWMTGTEDVTEEKELANKDTIVVSMLTVLVVLVIGNLIIVGCSLYSRYEQDEIFCLECVYACVSVCGYYYALPSDSIWWN